MLSTAAWLIDESCRAELAALMARAPEARRIAPTARAESDLLTVASSTATIAVRGVLMPERSWLLDAFGVAQTSYAEIIAAVATARGDSRVRTVVWDIASPGGAVEGLFDALEAARTLRAEKSTRVTSTGAASAAYALAAVAGPITARTEADGFGSIGIVAELRLDAQRVEVTSTEAPNKRPDVRTEEGRATVRAYLDQVHELFAEAVAAGRGVTTATVNRDYGRGGLMTARAALKAGLIDGIATTTTSATASGGRGKAHADMPRPMNADKPALSGLAAYVASLEAREPPKREIKRTDAAEDAPLHVSAIAEFLQSIGIAPAARDENTRGAPAQRPTTTDDDDAPLHAHAIAEFLAHNARGTLVSR